MADTLIVNVLTGRNFTSAHSNFCISISLSTVPSLKKTKPHKSNQKTVFDINEIIQFQFDKNTPADLNITCYDSENVFTKKNTIGTLKLPLGQIHKKAIDGWFVLTSNNSPQTEQSSKHEPKNDGELHLEISLKVEEKSKDEIFFIQLKKSEQEYCAYLDALMEVFFVPLKKVVTAEKLDSVFPQSIVNLRDIHQSILEIVSNPNQSHSKTLELFISKLSTTPTLYSSFLSSLRSSFASSATLLPSHEELLSKRWIDATGKVFSVYVLMMMPWVKLTYYVDLCDQIAKLESLGENNSHLLVSRKNLKHAFSQIQKQYFEILTAIKDLVDLDSIVELPSKWSLFEHTRILLKKQKVSLKNSDQSRFLLLFNDYFGIAKPAQTDSPKSFVCTEKELFPINAISIKRKKKNRHKLSITPTPDSEPIIILFDGEEDCKVFYDTFLLCQKNLEQNILEHEVIRLRTENSDLRRHLTENPSYDFVGLIERMHQRQVGLLESNGNEIHIKWLEAELRKEIQAKQTLQLEVLELKQKIIKLEANLEDSLIREKNDTNLISKLEELHTRQLQTALHLTATNTPLLRISHTGSDVLKLDEDWFSDSENGLSVSSKSSGVSEKQTSGKTSSKKEKKEKAEKSEKSEKQEKLEKEKQEKLEKEKDKFEIDESDVEITAVKKSASKQQLPTSQEKRHSLTTSTKSSKQLKIERTQSKDEQTQTQTQPTQQTTKTTPSGKSSKKKSEKLLRSSQ